MYICPQDVWVRCGKFSFLIIDIPTLKWSDARRTRQKLGGDLAIIKSAAENNFVFGLTIIIIKRKTVTVWGVWFGLARKADTRFYWNDDTPVAKGYTAWATGESNSVKEKCAHLYGTGNRAGNWNDILRYQSNVLDECPSYSLQEKSKLSDLHPLIQSPVIASRFKFLERSDLLISLK